MGSRGDGAESAGSSPLHFAVVLAQWEELLLHLVPPLQAAPQPVGVHHVQLSARLGLPHLLCAYKRGAMAWLFRDPVQSLRHAPRTRPHAYLGPRWADRVPVQIGLSHYVITRKMLLKIPHETGALLVSKNGCRGQCGCILLHELPRLSLPPPRAGPRKA